VEPGQAEKGRKAREKGGGFFFWWGLGKGEKGAWGKMGCDR